MISVSDNVTARFIKKRSESNNIRAVRRRIRQMPYNPQICAVIRNRHFAQFPFDEGMLMHSNECLGQGDVFRSLPYVIVCAPAIVDKSDHAFMAPSMSGFQC